MFPNRPCVLANYSQTIQHHWKFRMLVIEATRIAHNDLQLQLEIPCTSLDID